MGGQYESEPNEKPAKTWHKKEREANRPPDFSGNSVSIVWDKNYCAAEMNGERTAQTSRVCAVRSRRAAPCSASRELLQSAYRFVHGAELRPVADLCEI